VITSKIHWLTKPRSRYLVCSKSHFLFTSRTFRLAIPAGPTCILLFVWRFIRGGIAVVGSSANKVRDFFPSWWNRHALWRDHPSGEKAGLCVLCLSWRSHSTCWGLNWLRQTKWWIMLAGSSVRMPVHRISGLILSFNIKDIPFCLLLIIHMSYQGWIPRHKVRQSGEPCGFKEPRRILQSCVTEFGMGTV